MELNVFLTETSLASNLRDQFDSCATTVLVTGVITTAVFTALLVAVVSVAIHIAMYQCVYKSRLRNLDTANHGVEQSSGNPIVHDVISETVMQMTDNEAYGTSKAR